MSKLGKYQSILLETPFLNAAGVWCQTHKELLELNSSKIGGIITKSITLYPREGNPEPRYYHNEEEGWSLNSMGLPNGGVDYYLEIVPQISKPLIFSVAGMTLEENKAIIEKIITYFEKNKLLNIVGKYGVELNPSCPNLVNKSNLGYDFVRLKEYLDVLLPIIRWKLPNMTIGLKLPPYFQPFDFDRLGTLLENYCRQIDYLSSINSLPNCLVLDKDKKPLIVPKGGLGGFGGKMIKPLALANVKQLKDRLGDMFDLVGCGGVFTKDDFDDYCTVGAKAVSIGTALKIEGTNIFEKLN
jgi:dihydroorotate dehydrogenase (fumarate)